MIRKIEVEVPKGYNKHFDLTYLPTYNLGACDYFRLAWPYTAEQRPVSDFDRDIVFTYRDMMDTIGVYMIRRLLKALYETIISNEAT